MTFGATGRNGAAERPPVRRAGGPPPARSGTDDRQAAAARGTAQLRFAQSFAQIVSVLMRDPGYRSLAISDLEWLVLPAVAAGQFRLAHATMPAEGMPAEGAAAQQGGALVPAAVALWARVSPLIDKALSENLDKGVRLSPGAWTSGDILWLIAIGGHPRAVPAFLRQLREHEFKDKAVKMRRRMPDGTRIVVDLHQPQTA
jgi:hemolysin-activating ACP:hemolysin acyltransferase